jgi:uncharacterized oxidoreductase
MQKLKAATKLYPALRIFQCDINDENSVKETLDTIFRSGGIDILVNNAGKEFVYDLKDHEENAFEYATEEMQTNYLSSIRLIQLSLPHLQQKPEAAIVNIISLLAYQPMVKAATYSASKTALHVYTKALRFALKGTAVKVIGVYPPGVDTLFSKTIKTKKISPEKVATAVLRGLKRNKLRINIGITKLFYPTQKLFPSIALQMLNNVFIRN